MLHAKWSELKCKHFPWFPAPPPSHHTVPNALLPPTEGPGSGVELAQERTRAADLEVALQATRHAVCHPQIERGGAHAVQ